MGRYSPVGVECLTCNTTRGHFTSAARSVFTTILLCVTFCRQFWRGILNSVSLLSDLGCCI